jgi:hypothetical protein
MTAFCQHIVPNLWVSKFEPESFIRLTLSPLIRINSSTTSVLNTRNSP